MNFYQKEAHEKQEYLLVTLYNKEVNKQLKVHGLSNKEPRKDIERVNRPVASLPNVSSDPYLLPFRIGQRFCYILNFKSDTTLPKWYVIEFIVTCFA